MTLAQAQTAARWLGRRSKFNARRTPGAYNRIYASASEAAYSHEIALLERAGEISDVQCQPRVELEPGVRCVPDFSFLERGHRIFLEVKGFETPKWLLIASLWQLHGPGILRVVKKVGKGFVVTRTIVPQPRKDT